MMLATIYQNGPDLDVELSQVVRHLIVIFQQSQDSELSRQALVDTLKVSDANARFILEVEEGDLAALCEKILDRGALILSFVLPDHYNDKLTYSDNTDSSFRASLSREVICRLSSIAHHSYASLVAHPKITLNDAAIDFLLDESPAFKASVAPSLTSLEFLRFGFDSLLIENALSDFKKRKALEAKKDLAVLLKAPDGLMQRCWPEEDLSSIARRRFRLNTRLSNGRVKNVAVGNKLKLFNILEKNKNRPLLESLLEAKVTLNLSLQAVWYEYKRLDEREPEAMFEDALRLFKYLKKNEEQIDMELVAKFGGMKSSDFIKLLAASS